jgi:hypothetical protein
MDLTAAKIALVDAATLVIFTYYIIKIVWEEIAPGVRPIVSSLTTTVGQWRGRSTHASSAESQAGSDP